MSVIDKKCPMVNKSKSVIGHHMVKSVRESHKHVENKVKP